MSATSPRSKKTGPAKNSTEPKGDFTFTTEAGDTITLPPFGAKPGVMRKIRKLSEVDQFFTILEYAVGKRREEQIAEVRRELVAERVAEGQENIEISDSEIERDYLDKDPTLDIIDDMENEEFLDLQRGWFEHAGINLGE